MKTFLSIFKTLLILILIANCCTIQAQKTTTIYYVVRHAEKDTGRDPKLSEAGKIRAGDLYRILKNKRIQKIYTTKYLRSKMTGDSLRIYQHIDTLIYNADTTGNGLVERINLADEKSKSILIIGHSNTVPIIIRKLGVKDFTEKELSESAFDDLFIIRIKNNKAKFQQTKYGKFSPSANATATPLSGKSMLQKNK